MSVGKARGEKGKKGRALGGRRGWLYTQRICSEKRQGNRRTRREGVQGGGECKGGRVEMTDLVESVTAFGYDMRFLAGETKAKGEALEADGAGIVVVWTVVRDDWERGGWV